MMTGKQKIAGGMVAVILVVVFVFLYRQFSSQNEGTMVPSATLPKIPVPSSALSESAVKNTSSPASLTPTTPDDITADILKNDADTSILDEETTGEEAAINESVQTFDTLTHAYEEQSL